jgi:hypothetical protein
MKGLAPEVWDPFTGTSDPVAYEQEGENTSLSINLAPYESRTFVFLPGSRPVAAVRTAGNRIAPVDLATNWKVTYSKGTESEQMEVLHSWADEPKHRYYSGEVVYEKDVEVPPAFLESSRPVSLDFGEGRALEMVNKPGPGMQAWIDGPVREAAVVYINGQKAGYVWHPPYRVRVDRFLHSGVNHVRIVAGNSAINELAGQASPDYRLLNLRYGIRFTPQDMEDLKPLPSGVVGPLKLIAE